MILNYWFIISFQVEVYLSNKTYWSMLGFEPIPLALIANALSGEPLPGISQGSKIPSFIKVPFSSSSNFSHSTLFRKKIAN